MIQVTVCDVRDIYSNNMSDGGINRLIAMVQSKMGECVETSYDTPTGEMVLIYAVCHFIQARTGEATQKKSANGASINYEYLGQGEGVMSTQAGRQLAMIDTEKCYNLLFATTILFGTAGNSASAC